MSQPKPESKKPSKEPEAGVVEKTEDGKVKSYHGGGIFSIDN